MLEFLKARLCFLTLFLAFGIRSQGATLTFNTSDAPGDGQGWWTLSIPSTPDNYLFITGYTTNPNREFRSHLSFMLSGLTDPIQSAVLRLSQWGSFSNNNQFSGNVTLGLFDVTTDATLLNSVSGVQPAIFNDVGSGASYGTSVIAISREDTRVLEIPLNQQAIAAMRNNAFFSVGMAILDGDGTTYRYLFGNTGLVPSPFVHELRIQTEPIPEPRAAALFGITIVIVTLGVRRRAKWVNRSQEAGRRRRREEEMPGCGCSSRCNRIACGY